MINSPDARSTRKPLRIVPVVILILVLSFLVVPLTSVQADQVLTNGRIVNSAMAVDNAGDILVVGSTAGFGRGQAMALLLKYDPSGKLLCLKTIGPETTVVDTFGYGVTFDSSNNIYVTGGTQSFDGQRFHVFLQKFDSSCNFVYQVAWGGLGNDVGRAVTVDALDNVYVTGYTGSYGSGQLNVFLLKYDAAGEFQFSKIWGGAQNDYGNGVAADGSGNIYVTGVANNFTKQMIFLLKYDPLGNLLLQRTWGGTQNDYASGIIVDPANNVYITGYTFSAGVTQGVASVLLLKYDSSGNLLFQKTWGGKLNDYGSGLTMDSAGNVYVTGYTYSSSITPGVASVLVLKYDQSGNLLLQRIWGGKRSDYGYAIAVDPGANIYVTGYTYSFGIAQNPQGFQNPNTQGPYVFLLKYDSMGDLLVQKTYGGGTPDISP